jgi:siderophore synthetase component
MGHSTVNPSSPFAAVTVHLPPETERTLREKATSAGVTLEAYLRELAERDATRSARAATLDEILAPVREGFAESGMTEDELTVLFEEARDEVWREKQQGRSKDRPE